MYCSQKISKIRLMTCLLCWLIIQIANSQTDVSLYDSDYDSLNAALERARVEKKKKKLANLYYQLAKYEEEHLIRSENTLDYYLRARQYFQRINDTEMINTIDFLIAQRYQKAGLYSDAESIYKNMMPFYEKKKDLSALAEINNQLGIISSTRADNEKALEYASLAIKQAKSSNNLEMSVKYAINKLAYHRQLNEPDSALAIAANCFKVSSELQNNELAAKSLYYISTINNDQKNYKRAIKYGLQSELLAGNKPYDESRKNIYFNLSQAYAAVDSNKKALKYLMQFTDLNDSISDIELTESLNNLAVKHQSDENKKKSQLLEIEKKFAERENEQQRIALYFLMGGIALLILMLYYYIRFYSQKIDSERIISEQKDEINHQKIRELEDELKIKGMQSMITGQEKERERIAKDLHDSLGGLLSTIKLQFENAKAKLGLKKDDFDKTSQMLDDAVEEVRNISRNLQPSSLARLGLVAAIRDLVNRYKDEAYPEIFFQYYDMPPNLDNLTSLSIYRIIQELLNNTIKHAQAQEVLIQFTREGNELVIQYEDDGLGFDINQSGRGLGLENIKSRLNFLNATVAFDTKPGEGTSILIHVPIIDK